MNLLSNFPTRNFLLTALLLASVTVFGQKRDTIVVYDTVKLYLPSPNAGEKKSPESQNNDLKPRQEKGSELSGTETNKQKRNAIDSLEAENSNASLLTETPEGEPTPWPPHGLNYFPLHFGFFTPLELPFRAGNYLTNFSLGLLGTTTGSVYGIGVAGLYRHNHFDYKGIDVSGIHSSNGGDFWGMQTAGIDVLTKGDFYGVQTGGIFTFTGGDNAGIQTGGIVAITHGYQKGVQTGGIVAITRGSKVGLQTGGMASLTRKNMTGLQVGGLSSVTKGNMTGLQVGGIYSQAKRMSGLQVAGIANFARKLNGVQIGLINICDSIESGFSLGLINVVRKQFYGEIDLISANYMHFGVQYSMGSRLFHTIFLGGGHNIGNYNSQLVLGFGLGSQIDLGSNFSIHPQIVSHNYYNSAPSRWASFGWDWTSILDEEYISNWTTHIKLGFSYHIAKRIGIKFIPSVFISNNYEGYRDHIREAESHDEYGVTEYSDGAGYRSQMFQRIGKSNLGFGLGLSGSISFRF